MHAAAMQGCRSQLHLVLAGHAEPGKPCSHAAPQYDDHAAVASKCATVLLLLLGKQAGLLGGG